MDDLITAGWAQAGFAFLWGITGYIAVAILWRDSKKVLRSISDALSAITNILVEIRSDIDLGDKVIGLSHKVEELMDGKNK